MTRPLTCVFASCALLVALAAPAHGQAGAASVASGPQTFTLAEALQYAVDHYPAVQAALEQVTMSSAGVDEARTAFLPRLDTMWQTSRATANNIFGQVLPQSVIPAMSGPVLPATSSQSVWGSAAGALLSWEPFDFGTRDASIRVARAGVARAQADVTLTRLEVQGAVGAAFFAVAQADQAAAAARADVDRRTTLARTARALADNELRPGADASRAEAESAAAETRAIQARQAAIVARAVLARLMGVTTGPIDIDRGHLLAAAPPAATAALVPEAATHPLAQARQAAIDLARTREDVLARVFRPRVFLQSSLFARGSGANTDGAFDGGANGLWLERANWAAGVQVVFPNLFELSNLRAKRAASAASTRQEQARLDDAVLAVSTQRQVADAMVDAARAIAANTPIQLAAARQSEAQATARYQAGLTNLVEVAEAQNLLAQAEYLDAAARVDLWRAELARAVARGDVVALAGLASAGSR